MIAAALSQPPPPTVTQANWEYWHRYGWLVCPATRNRVCDKTACSVGARCKRLGDIGLAGDKTALSWNERPTCGALNRKGGLCKLRVDPGRRRCRLHGGRSTGPRTDEGKARVAQAQRKRWTKWRAEKRHASQ
ncbi:HGGxSTG domain-containing protein [Aurantimonas sp. HBX-1]|uniref:HGGxSTG domain-containing protein n=1 Tax=Aurantimonas sp. HBX-1 TaxID=2906072 RepID=UPI00351D74A3